MKEVFTLKTMMFLTKLFIKSLNINFDEWKVIFFNLFIDADIMKFILDIISDNDDSKQELLL